MLLSVPRAVERGVYLPAPFVTARKQPFKLVDGDLRLLVLWREFPRDLRKRKIFHNDAL